MSTRDDQNFDFWRQQAGLHGEAPEASWSDRQVIELEIAAIRGRIPAPGRVVDVGCANGYSTVHYAELDGVEIVGLDYVPEMVEAAERRRAGLPAEIAGRIEFGAGDARSLPLPDESFDCVVSTRVIINLGSWEGQQQGLREYERVLKHGGTLLLSEATVGGWRRLNRLRGEFGLPDIPVPGFNTYLDEELLVAFLQPSFELVELVDFASTYYVATRVAKPLLAAAAGRSQEFVLDPTAEFNRWAALLPASGDYGVQKLFVLRKTGTGPGTGT